MDVFWNDPIYHEHCNFISSFNFLTVCNCVAYIFSKFVIK